MFDTMTMTKVTGALCGALLVYLLGGWAAESIYHHSDGGHGDVAQAYVIDTGVEEDSAAVEEGPAFADLLAVADSAKGAKVFAKCRACHSVENKNGTGPYMNAVVGRAMASIDGFAYSSVLVSRAGESWTAEELNGFLENPKGYAPGTKMSFAGLKKAEDRANVISYLETLQ